MIHADVFMSIQAPAATLIQERWREYVLLLRVRRMHELQRRQEQERRELAEAAAQRRAQAKAGWTLTGVLPRVWVIVREVLLVMCASIFLVLVFPPEFHTSAPAAFRVRGTDPPLAQAQAALAGAAVAVAAFACFFLTLALLYVYRWDRALYTLHSAWIGTLLGGPIWLLLRHVLEAMGVAVDTLTVVISVCNLSVPGVVLVHWSATATRFAYARQLYADVIAIGCAWVLVGVAWSTAVAALLMLAFLDVLLVAIPGAPVQRLDAIQTDRNILGERQMPGLSFKAKGLELGFGDFVVYGAFAAHAARAGVAPMGAVMAAVAAGLILTMARIALARVRTVLPALPLAVAMAASLLALERLAIQPVAAALASSSVSL